MTQQCAVLYCEIVMLVSVKTDSFVFNKFDKQFRVDWFALAQSQH